MAPPPTEEELRLIAIVRDKLGDISEEYFKEDIVIIRFLRVKDGNTEAAEKMIRATIAWRKEFNVDFLATAPLNEKYAQSFPLVISGRDRMGQPLVTVSMGSWDLRPLGDEAIFTQFRLYCIGAYERIMAEVRRADEERPRSSPRITQYTVIYDYSGFSFKPLFNVSVDKHMGQIIAIVENYYPDTLGNGIYINCPPTINTILSLVKPFMSNKSFQAIQHFGTSRDKWQEAVLALVDPSQLTPQFGGTKVVAPAP